MTAALEATCIIITQSPWSKKNALAYRTRMRASIAQLSGRLTFSAKGACLCLSSIIIFLGHYRLNSVFKTIDTWAESLCLHDGSFLFLFVYSFYVSLLWIRTCNATAQL